MEAEKKVFLMSLNMVSEVELPVLFVNVASSVFSPLYKTLHSLGLLQSLYNSLLPALFDLLINISE